MDRIARHGTARVTSGKQAVSKLAETTWVVLASVTGTVALLSVMRPESLVHIRRVGFDIAGHAQQYRSRSSLGADMPQAPLAAAACLR
ncbi:MAG: hypothetical protein U0892_07270 [Pirellulales bacterium]